MGSDALLRNGGAQRFSDATSASGLATTGGSGASVIGDYNNDGLLDIFVAGANGGAPALWLNKGDGTFSAIRDLTLPSGRCASRSRRLEFVDYDNDGWLDLVVAGTPARAGLRKSGRISLSQRSREVRRPLEPAPAAVHMMRGASLAAADIDDDGDEDLFVADPDGNVRLLRNDGGNENLAARIELKGSAQVAEKQRLRHRVQGRASRGRHTSDARRNWSRDALWPWAASQGRRASRGVDQRRAGDGVFPGRRRKRSRKELLKGSCPFLYTWDGKGFRFVTDVMWRSALGMPLGLMGSASTFAPAGSSQQYLRIPGVRFNRAMGITCFSSRKSCGKPCTQTRYDCWRLTTRIPLTSS